VGPSFSYHFIYLIFKRANLRRPFGQELGFLQGKGNLALPLETQGVWAFPWFGPFWQFKLGWAIPL